MATTIKSVTLPKVLPPKLSVHAFVETKFDSNAGLMAHNVAKINNNDITN